LQIRTDSGDVRQVDPSGSVPMAALMMATTTSADSMAGMNMSDMNMHAGASAPPAISPELSMPYGFPKPGHYRIF
jgi:hypothetical protein